LATARSEEPNGIIGGEQAIEGQYPWLVNRRKRCVGALIKPNWFITAGHCDYWVGEYIDINRWDLVCVHPHACT
jgi:secreted trypsin-like serine protease